MALKQKRGLRREGRGRKRLPIFSFFLLLFFPFLAGGVTQHSIPQISYPLQIPKKGGKCPIRGIPLIPKGKICYGCPAHFQLLRSPKKSRYLCYRCPSNFQLGKREGKIDCWKR
ncbi:MAG: hypothetical protein ABGW77_04575 [Campylobacterales bacterium]